MGDKKVQFNFYSGKKLHKRLQVQKLKGSDGKVIGYELKLKIFTQTRYLNRISDNNSKANT